MLAQKPEHGGGKGRDHQHVSVNAVLAIPNQVPYTSARGALNQLTKVIRFHSHRKVCA